MELREKPLTLPASTFIPADISMHGAPVPFASASVVVLFAGALVGLVMPDVPVALVPSALCLLTGAVLLARSAATWYFGTPQLLCVLFFALAALHNLCGFLLAGLTTTHTSIRSNEDVYYANALLINAVGLLAGAIGYSWHLFRRSESAVKRSSFLLRVDPAAAELCFRILAAAGAALMFYVYYRIGVLAYLAVPAKWPFLRYVTSDLAGGSPRDEWFANRAMDFLTVSLPFLVYRVARAPRARIPNVALIVVGYVALLLPLRRANLLGVLFASLILIGIGRRDVYRLALRCLILLGSLYVISQCIFLLGVLAKDFNPRAVLTVSSTALPEVRDLAWTLNRLDGEQLDGVTFVQALVPLPSIASDWSMKNSLRAITTRLIGVDQTGESGGLRLTIMGEGFINFGYLGAIAVSFLWGYGVAWCECLLRRVQHVRADFMSYVAVMCFIWICFLVYLAGTQAAASVKMGALLALGVAWISRVRPSSYGSADALGGTP